MLVLDHNLTKERRHAIHVQCSYATEYNRTLISEKECLLLGPTGTCVKKVFEEREMYC